MNYIFSFLILTSIIIGIFSGNTENIVNEMLKACNVSVKIAFSLIGIMAFWLGIMRVAEKSGVIKVISKILYPVMRILFKDVDKKSPTLGNIAMSIGANALGLMNAATPIGIKVMKELQEKNKNKELATDSMCMFLAMNTAGFQIMPATVIAILVGLGATNPAKIILPTLIVTTLTFLSAIFLALIFAKLWKLKEINND
ncbi:nucleoside recognition protein [bacterium]|nr:nucleoside recognition protein [bacterium]